MARQIVVEVVGDASKYGKTLDAASGKTSKFNSVLSGIGVGAGFGLITRGFDLVAGAITDGVKNASELEQSIGAIESVFGPAAKKIEKFGDTAAEAMGLSRREVNESAAVFGAQLQGMGFSADEAAEQTMNLQKRAADMAATFGGTTAEALEAVGSLMRGERDPIEKYGVSLKQADINAALAAQGLDGLTGAAAKQAEAQVALDILMQQTNKTQGQFGREAESAAGSQQIMNAKMENATARLGKMLLPAMTAVAEFAADVLIPAFEKFVTWLGNTWKAIEPGVKAFLRDLMPALRTVWDFLSKNVIPIIMKIVTTVYPALWEATKFVAGVFSTVFSAIASYVGTAVKNVTGFINNVKSVISSVITTVVGVKNNVIRTFSDIVNFVTGLPGKIGRAARGMWDGIAGAFKSAINSIIRGWNSIQFTVPRVDLGPLGSIGGFTIGLPDIPYLHAGGIVPGTPGSDVPAILQAGETVIPRGKAGATEVHIHIHEGAYIDGPSVDRLAQIIAQRMRLQGVG